MAINVAIANHKGGVGKSTSSLMIAEGLALFHGRRVLVLDLDSQGMVSRMMLSRHALDEAARERRTMMDLLSGYAGNRSGALAYHICPGASDITQLRRAGDHRRVDIIPCHPKALRDYRSMETMLRTSFARKNLDEELARMLDFDLQRVKEHYDIILFDCAAGITPTSLAALRLSSVVISPTMLERNSIDALVDFLQIVVESDLKLNSKGRLVYILMTMFHRSSPSQQLLLDTVQRGIKGLNAIRTPISHSGAIQRAVVHPGEGASRLVEEKYGASLPELQSLATAVNDLIEGANRQRVQARPVAAR